MSYKHRILITGGTGYIGSHTAVELIQKGYGLIQKIKKVKPLSSSEISYLLKELIYF